MAHNSSVSVAGDGADLTYIRLQAGAILVPTSSYLLLRETPLPSGEIVNLACGPEDFCKIDFLHRRYGEQLRAIDACGIRR